MYKHTKKLIDEIKHNLTMLPEADILKETKLNLKPSRSNEDPQWIENRIDHIQSTVSADESQARLLQDRIIA